MRLQISVEETKEAVAHWLRTMKHVDVKPAQLEVIDNVDLTRLID